MRVGAVRPCNEPAINSEVYAFPLHLGKFAGVGVLEAWSRLFLVRGQRHPALEAEHRPAAGTCCIAAPLRVHDAASSRHDVDFTGADRLHIALAVAVQDLAIDEVGQGCKPDMRVWTRVETFTRLKSDRAEAVEKDERSDHAAMHGRQGAANLEAIAEITDGR